MVLVIFSVVSGPCYLTGQQQSAARTLHCDIPKLVQWLQPLGITFFSQKLQDEDKIFYTNIFYECSCLLEMSIMCEWVCVVCLFVYLFVSTYIVTQKLITPLPTECEVNGLLWFQIPESPEFMACLQSTFLIISFNSQLQIFVGKIQ